eukprot:NODE_3114_length_2090_cov_10.816098.p1 GENE.NODE_3114_length_2090_cov_10.816098~~NODE_3114_length_2090_cov_10.816098.p1  ORF type:complete len:532 (-),score=162.01 NODE_3114_length_2090_cov_10.816098:379-1974(-)
MPSPLLNRWNGSICPPLCGANDVGGASEMQVQVQLLSEVSGVPPRSGDCLDPSRMQYWPSAYVPSTKRFSILQRLGLPPLPTYAGPALVNSDVPKDIQQAVVVQMYQDFVVDLHAGLVLTQMTSDHGYCDMHCQLMDDLCTLKFDQRNGRIVEIPLTVVWKLEIVMSHDNQWYRVGRFGPSKPPPLAEYVIIMEFMRQMLVFVFKTFKDARRFMVFLELLIRRANGPRKPHDLPSSGATARGVRGGGGASGAGTAARDSSPSGGGAGGDGSRGGVTGAARGGGDSGGTGGADSADSAGGGTGRGRGGAGTAGTARVAARDSGPSGFADGDGGGSSGSGGKRRCAVDCGRGCSGGDGGSRGGDTGGGGDGGSGSGAGSGGTGGADSADNAGGGTGAVSGARSRSNGCRDSDAGAGCADGARSRADAARFCIGGRLGSAGEARPNGGIGEAGGAGDGDALTKLSPGRLLRARIIEGVELSLKDYLPNINDGASSSMYTGGSSRYTDGGAATSSRWDEVPSESPHGTRLDMLVV